MKWWGYLHNEGSLHVKRFFDFQDIEEAEESSFVKITAGPFDADDRHDAIEKLREKLCLS